MFYLTINYSSSCNWVYRSFLRIESSPLNSLIFTHFSVKELEPLSASVKTQTRPSGWRFFESWLCLYLFIHLLLHKGSRSLSHNHILIDMLLSNVWCKLDFVSYIKTLRKKTFLGQNLIINVINFLKFSNSICIWQQPIGEFPNIVVNILVQILLFVIFSSCDQFSNKPTRHKTSTI